MLTGSITLTALLFEPLCQLLCEHRNPHSCHISAKPCFYLKLQFCFIHAFCLIKSLSKKKQNHSPTHTHTDLDRVEPSAYKALSLLSFLTFDLLLLLPVNMPTFHLCHTYLTFCQFNCNRHCCFRCCSKTVFWLWRNK